MTEQQSRHPPPHLRGVLMTILYSIYTSRGLVWAADAMLTVQVHGGTQIYDSTRPKVFAVPAVGDHPRGGLLGYFGNRWLGR